MPRFSLLLLLVFLTGLSLTAQELYNVRIGTFQDVKADDFVELRELGFVYGLSRDGQLTDVYLGNYSSRQKAESVTEELKSKGFRNAAPFALPAGEGQAQPYVQIALRGRNRSLDWRALERAGKLYVDAADGVTKVVTGPYKTNEAANEALSDIRGMGFADAFVKSLRSNTLIPVGVFETGIKKPLIPIELRQVEPPVAEAAAADTSPEAEPATDSSQVRSEPSMPAPADMAPATPTQPTEEASGEEAMVAKEPAAEESTPTPALLPVDKPGIPAIDMKTKRHSAAELQRVLKEKGFYDSSIDGLYGPGTQSAYIAAWSGMPELQKYRVLAAADYSATNPNGNTPLTWPEVAVMLTIADELAAGLRNADKATALENARGGLINATRALATTPSREALDWETTIWKNLDEWATQDPLHAQILSALRLTYYQSQARFEAMYQQRGLSPIEARNLATASLQNLLSAQLDRFL